MQSIFMFLLLLLLGILKRVSKLTGCVCCAQIYRKSQRPCRSVTPQRMDTSTASKCSTALASRSTNKRYVRFVTCAQKYMFSCLVLYEFVIY